MLSILADSLLVATRMEGRTAAARDALPEDKDENRAADKRALRGLRRWF